MKTSGGGHVHLADTNMMGEASALVISHAPILLLHGMFKMLWSCEESTLHYMHSKIAPLDRCVFFGDEPLSSFCNAYPCCILVWFTAHTHTSKSFSFDSTERERETCDRTI
jgi:hypothetical protein